MKSSKLAIHGGTPVRSPEKQWPYWPVFDDTERNALIEVLESRQWFNAERGTAFEERFAAFQDARHCVLCSSGTAALTIALQAIGIGPGDEVIVPPYTFVATASAVAIIGAIPVFVDVDETWNLNPDLAEQAITSRTKAIVPVHFGGMVCDMDRFNAIGAKHGVRIIEDACHSWGAKWNGKGTGALGHAGVFSFQASKNMTSGEGGAILTDDDEMAEVCRSIVDCGRGTDGIWYNHVRVGANARLSEFQAALLMAQLARLDAQNDIREKNAAILDHGLREIDGLTIPPRDKRITRQVYHLYELRLDAERFGCSRMQLIEAAECEGLPLSAGYARPLYKQAAFSGEPYASCHCPVAEDLCYNSGLWIIHSMLLGSEQDMRDIIGVFQKIKANVSALRKQES